MKALIIATNGFEDNEFSYPYYRLKEADFEVDVATPDSKSVSGKHGTEFEADLAIKDAEMNDYDLLVIPGGRSPEHLRMEAPESIDLVKEFYDADKPISAICHGTQLLMSADVLEGKRATCYWSIRDDLEHAGATFVDRSVVVDNNLITSRHPDDLPDFMRETLKKFE
ncbi:hypothetical protein AKJ66_00790 [candidate division MSBL1 archaeon SCGC-AAA259E22]|uniref:DJ-1/PfpI domain-containing protein n=1 Tax=candidate division MSBL1 archaeon SCGC-AAA259E22 TaxID=1698265 RepID=A0A133UHY1_9EURY|nr:hypothetical protein AKJ66_00790 [candidate division MSBL1 archaeon SCGC-AAA259E22]